MRIAIVSPYDLGLPGGVQDQAIRLTRWLRDLGHDSTLVGPGVEGPEGAVLLGPTARIDANRATAPIALDPRVTKRLRSAVADVDVVHVHEPLMPLVSTAATSIRDIATVGTFHADPPAWARFGYRIGSQLWKRSIRRLDVVTTVSHVSGSAIASFVNARVIPNGIDVDHYGNNAKITNRVAFLGRDDERKGLQVLLDAWPVVSASLPDAELRVIGSMRDQEIPGVTFLGRVDETRKIEELGSAEVYCAPNLGGESFGVVLTEGMASGCAVVASAIPAFVGVLGDAGDLVAPGDSQALAECIVSLLTDRDKLTANQAASRSVVSRFDGWSVAAQYLAAYNDAITRHRK
ncbi:MAG: glycosyltransferase family 4 protein [Acidimicrobiia bacterium]|nr:MAG: glycosyltransferase family 4 protein [Acidimicrobiia bacterium]